MACHKKHRTEVNSTQKRGGLLLTIQPAESDLWISRKVELELKTEEQRIGIGEVSSFEVPGELEAIGRFLPHLKYAYLAPNLGQVETIVGPPTLTSHVELSDAERAASGIPEGLVRYPVGFEGSDVLKRAMEDALSLL